MRQQNTRLVGDRQAQTLDAGTGQHATESGIAEQGIGRLLRTEFAAMGLVRSMLRALPPQKSVSGQLISRSHENPAPEPVSTSIMTMKLFRSAVPVPSARTFTEISKFQRALLEPPLTGLHRPV